MKGPQVGYWRKVYWADRIFQVYRKGKRLYHVYFWSEDDQYWCQILTVRSYTGALRLITSVIPKEG